LKRILILSQPKDIHAYAVGEALRRKGGLSLIWLTSDFPSLSRESVRFRRGKKAVKVHGPELNIEDIGFDTIWNRRPSFVVDPSILDAADVKFAEFECSYFRKGLFSLFDPGTLWVNSPDAAFRANRKMLQHECAARVGLQTPDSLYSNDPDQIRSFIGENGGRVIYKPFTAAPWQNEDTFWLPFTSVLTTSQLPSDPVLSATPGIYQCLVPKAFELRVTVMGHSTFAAKILSQETLTGKIDWRKSYGELKMEPFEMPESLADSCIRLLDELNLVFGCFDFIVTPEGEYVFLEVNEMGQFLFLETRTGMPLLDAFTDFLLSGTRDFKWQEPAKPLRYLDVSEIAVQEAEASARGHISPPNQVFQEEPSRAQS
jgi:hypothetical protein